MDTSNSDDDADVGKFEWPDSEDPVPIVRLVTGRLSVRENSPSQRFHIRFALGCGEGEFEGKDAVYSVHLRQCIVDIKTTGCRADLSSAYSFELPDRVISDHSSAKTSNSSGLGVEAEAKMDFAASRGISSRLSAVFKGSKKKERSESRDIKFNRRIMLVSCQADYWLVGDAEYGDPRNERGRLKERYFNENQDLPLCAIEVPSGVNVAEVRIEVRAKFGYLDVDVLDALGRPARPARSSDALDISDAMKARLRGIALAKAIREIQHDDRPGLRQPEREFLLLASTLRVHMPKSRESSGPPVVTLEPATRRLSSGGKKETMARKNRADP